MSRFFTKTSILLLLSTIVIMILFNHNEVNARSISAARKSDSSIENNYAYDDNDEYSDDDDDDDNDEAQSKQFLIGLGKETSTPNFVRMVLMRVVYGLASTMGIEERLDGAFNGAFVPPNADEGIFNFGGGGSSDDDDGGDFVELFDV